MLKPGTGRTNILLSNPTIVPGISTPQAQEKRQAVMSQILLQKQPKKLLLR
jgi:hypothetical protein